MLTKAALLAAGLMMFLPPGTGQMEEIPPSEPQAQICAVVTEYREPEPKTQAKEETPEAETVSAVPEPEPEEKPWNGPETFRITHYCSCRKCCGKSDGITASGVKATVGRTVAVDRRVIPLGSEVLINGKIYLAEDTGVKGHVIDIFCASHAEALELGTYKTTVQWR